MKALIALLCLLLLLGCTAKPIEKSKFVGDEKVIATVKSLEAIANDRNLTSEDIQTLRFLDSDSYAKGFLDDAADLIEVGQPEHATHSFAFLRTYLETGDLNVCVPHEIEHIGIYLSLNMTDKAKVIATEAEQYIQPWMDKQEKGRKLFPQVYLKHDETVIKIKSIISDVKNGKKPLQSDIDFVIENGIC